MAGDSKTPSELSEACEAMFTLLASGPPRFPRVAHEHDLTPQQLHLLRVLEPDGTGLPMGELAEQLFCDASNVTSIVDRLEDKQLIKRRPDPRDRRIKRIVLTKSGELFRESVLRKLYEPSPAFSVLSVDERKTLRDLLVKVALAHRR